MRPESTFHMTRGSDFGLFFLRRIQHLGLLKLLHHRSITGQPTPRVVRLAALNDKKLVLCSSDA